MKKMMFSLLAILLFFAVMVGAFNIFFNTNNRPYKVYEFIRDVGSIEFDISFLQNFINGDSTFPSSSGGGGNIGGHRDLVFKWNDDLPVWDNIGNFIKSCVNPIIAAFDFSINVVNWVVQVLRLLWNFCIGVPA